MIRCCIGQKWKFVGSGTTRTGDETRFSRNSQSVGGCSISKSPQCCCALLKGLAGRATGARSHDSDSQLLKGKGTREGSMATFRGLGNSSNIFQLRAACGRHDMAKLRAQGMAPDRKVRLQSTLCPWPMKSGFTTMAPETAPTVATQAVPNGQKDVSGRVAFQKFRHAGGP
jgi:hypothetical protein